MNDAVPRCRECGCPSPNGDPCETCTEVERILTMPDEQILAESTPEELGWAKGFKEGLGLGLRARALSPEQGVRDAIERMKADLGDAIREEENPGKDEFAKAFNYGLRAARDLALRLIDGKWQTLALKQPGAA
jgi:hypothetical protein